MAPRICKRFTALAALAAAVVAASCGDPAAPVGDAALPPPLADLARRDRAPRGDSALSDPAPRLAVSLSAGVEARVEPCGCPGAPSGGFARRATMLAGERRLEPSLFALEGPGLLGTLAEIPRLGRAQIQRRARELLRLLGSMGYAAFAPGGADLELVGARVLADAGRDARVPIVATNVGLRDGEAGFVRHSLLSAGPRRVGVLGVVATAPSPRIRAEIEVTEPVAAVRETLRDLPRVDAVLAFADVPSGSVRGLAAQVPEVDVWLVREERSGDPTEEKVAGSRILRLADGATALGRLDLVFTGPAGARLGTDVAREAAAEARIAKEHQLLRLDWAPAGRDPAGAESPGTEAARPSPIPAPGGGAGAAGGRGRRPSTPPTTEQARESVLREIRILGSRLAFGQGARHVAAFRTVPLPPQVPEDPGMRGRLDALRSVLLAGLVPGGDRPRTGQRFQGVDQCLRCHTAEYADWTHTAHATAYQRLVARDQADDPSCLPCHATGWGEEGGFVLPDLGRHLLGVQCEACHGPANGHPGQRVAFPPVTDTTCRRCHDAANSPKYDPGTYREAVNHRRGAVAGTDR